MSYVLLMFVINMIQRTTISIEHETLIKLQSLKIAKRESYDEIINRVLDMIK